MKHLAHRAASRIGNIPASVRTGEGASGEKKGSSLTSFEISGSVKVGPKFQLVIPKPLRTAVNLKIGDLLKVELRGDSILLTPMTCVERDLAAAEADVKAGRVYGPFSSARAAVRSLRREAKKLKKR